jgi:hypothetical protein
MILWEIRKYKDNNEDFILVKLVKQWHRRKLTDMIRWRFYMVKSRDTCK